MPADPLNTRWRTLLAHALFLGLALGAWEYAAQVGWLSATFFGKPSGIAGFLATNVADGKL
jgi:ABC-type nitrate/sulfonate/bicarbonate transport system permease component